MLDSLTTWLIDRASYWSGTADTAEGSVPPSTKVGMQTIQRSI